MATIGSTGQFLVTPQMLRSLSTFELMAFNLAISMRVAELKGLVELTVEETPIGTLYSWRPVR